MWFVFLSSQSKSILKEHSLSKHCHHLNQLRNLVDGSGSIKLVRDRGLDHAVEKEKNLLPLVNLKNFIKGEPSKSIPISVIVENRERLKIPYRPIDFIRQYPSFFEEFLPGGIGIHPHIRLTSEVLTLDAEEQLMYQSDSYKQQVADRLLKLLMISRIHKIPLTIIEHLKWDVGLPQDYIHSIIPEFPDYFRVVGRKDHAFGSENKQALELVCWSNELATSVMEKKFMNGEMNNAERKPIAFPLQFTAGFEMDKKYKKWLDDWQKLPYISPYENASYLLPKSDESDKWVVSVLHEILHILVPKKSEKENLLLLGEYLGLRSRFKRALLQHPGIFYLSHKIGTYTVVLREGYKRGFLIERHPLMTLRSQYVHLVNTTVEDSDAAKVQGKSTQQESKGKKVDGKAELVSNRGEEHKEEICESSNAKVEEASDTDDVDNDDEEQSHRVSRKNSANYRAGIVQRVNLDVKKPSRNSRRESSVGRIQLKTMKRTPKEVSRREQMHGRHRDDKSSQQRSKSPTSRARLTSKKTPT
ncbi:protein WHAT'S THIS FACTOR 9, mitochondrial [Neltuma alba]|uniref:protein WHAT'S THIS FACTOR 9, mitochondrial n=1 Tax=Neltuma alba TaxID=207710 RepID=UPI0010A453B6|nr:protein WHAT'S THIS FACTOR 9, mitochondrial [Prosopis alba]